LVFVFHSHMSHWPNDQRIALTGARAPMVCEWIESLSRVRSVDAIQG
jgi:hypothetical protein